MAIAVFHRFIGFLLVFIGFLLVFIGFLLVFIGFLLVFIGFLALMTHTLQGCVPPTRPFQREADQHRGKSGRPGFCRVKNDTSKAPGAQSRRSS